MEAMFIEAELARALRVRPPTLRYWRQRGIGPAFIKLNGRVIYRESAVERWLREREQATGATPADPQPMHELLLDFDGGEVA